MNLVSGEKKAHTLRGKSSGHRLGVLGTPGATNRGLRGGVSGISCCSCPTRKGEKQRKKTKKSKEKRRKNDGKVPPTPSTPTIKNLQDDWTIDGFEFPCCTSLAPLASPYFSQGPPNRGVSNGGVSRSGLVLCDPRILSSFFLPQLAACRSLILYPRRREVVG